MPSYKEPSISCFSFLTCLRFSHHHGNYSIADTERDAGKNIRSVQAQFYNDNKPIVDKTDVSSTHSTEFNGDFSEPQRLTTYKNLTHALTSIPEECSSSSGSPSEKEVLNLLESVLESGAAISHDKASDLKQAVAAITNAECTSGITQRHSWLMAGQKSALLPSHWHEVPRCCLSSSA